MKFSVLDFKPKAGIIFVSFALAAALVGCDLIKPPKPAKPEPAQPVAVKGTIIARVNNFPITLEEMNEMIESYNERVGNEPEAKITTRDQKINYLKNEMVRRSLLYQEALARGLDKKDDIVEALEKTKQELLVMEIVRQEAEKAEVASKEVEDYYNTYKEQLKKPEERRIREIVVPAEQDAKDILIQLLQGADFASLARERSRAASSKEGGDLGFIAKGKKPAQFDAAAFSDTLDVGKTSSIFKGPDGYYILKLEAKRGGEQPSLSEMWEDIKRGLTFLKQQQIIEDLINKLSRQAKLEFHEGEVK